MINVIKLMFVEEFIRIKIVIIWINYHMKMDVKLVIMKILNIMKKENVLKLIFIDFYIKISDYQMQFNIRNKISIFKLK